MMMYSIQIKRFRWCIPWCRKRLLGLKSMTRREKRRYYRGLLLQEEMDEMNEDSDDDEDVTTALQHREDDDDETAAPPMLWARLKAKGEFVARGPTVRKAGVPRAAVYDEPKPQLKKETSKKLMKSDSDFWNS
ncbi:uncharacterized protein LOC132724708 [Ruditapes philippinarum]|uniref:uncharacterized protein LOC132724708 n=1 Tax=Ruditapes philippinarum TaxID=129788 RepID=UPI00295C3178|nr:uncharacterized protein LOC132724708 [Ruditapes philippinarum]